MHKMSAMAIMFICGGGIAGAFASDVPSLAVLFIGITVIAMLTVINEK